MAATDYIRTLEKAKRLRRFSRFCQRGVTQNKIVHPLAAIQFNHFLRTFSLKSKPYSRAGIPRQEFPVSLTLVLIGILASNQPVLAGREIGQREAPVGGYLSLGVAQHFVGRFGLGGNQVHTHLY